MEIIVKTLAGLEEVLKSELIDLGAENIEVLNRAVKCTGHKDLVYKINLLSRTALRVLVFITEFEVRNERELYENVKKIKWEEYFGTENTFAIDSHVNSRLFNHANFLALKTKDAVVDRFRDLTGIRPSVDVKDPDIRIDVHVRNSTVSLNFDSSGSSLHMRGYRVRPVMAPLNEVLAAGLVLLSGWDKKTPFIDPMCGSGTILCEAAKIAGNIPPQSLDRRFAFKKWKTFDAELYRNICENATSEIDTSAIPEMKGSDISVQAIIASESNIKAAGLSDYIQISREDFFYYDNVENSMLMFNPPYDERLKESDIITFYKDIGDKLKNSFPGCTAWILSGHQDAIKNIGLRATSRKKLLNGSIDSLFCKYEMYSGTKKQKWKEKYGKTNN